jgi:hypothetical protein
LPLPPETFDLLISLFAGGIAHACRDYLKAGGLLISNNHHRDAQAAAADTSFHPLAAIQYKQGKYVLSEEDITSLLSSRKVISENPRYLRQGNRGLEYLENAYYFVFRKK